MADMLPLHGAAAVGEVRIFAEVHPDSVVRVGGEVRIPCTQGLQGRPQRQGQSFTPAEHAMQLVQVA